MRSIQRRCVAVTFVLGLGLLALLLVARLGTSPLPWPLPVLDTLALYAFAPFVGVGIVAIRARSRALTLVSLAAFLFFGQQFGTQVVGALGLTSATTVAAPTERSQIRVLTLNIQAQYAEPEELAVLVREQRPDLLVLQEVTTQYADVLNQSIAGDYPYWFAAGSETEHEGTGTWSRQPFADAEAFRLSAWGNALHRLRVITEHGDLWVYNIHLPNPTDPTNDDVDRGRLAAAWAFDEARRDAELDDLRRMVASHDTPVIVAGDFNLSAGSRAYRRLLPDWRDAFALTGTGFGHTYPTPEHDHEGDVQRWFKNVVPLLRIDYVFTTGGLTPIRSWTEQLLESDHLAVLADLDFPPSP